MKIQWEKLVWWREVWKWSRINLLTKPVNVYDPSLYRAGWKWKVYSQRL